MILKYPVYYLLSGILTLSFTQFLFSSSKSEHSFNSCGQTLTLTTETREVTTHMGESKLVLYSVYADEMFLHPEGAGGRLISCGKNLPQVHNLGSGDQQLGWMIVGYGICGNTMSYRVELIVPYPFPNTDRYLFKNFISKSVPHFHYDEKKPEIWFYLQNWGRGNTLESFFVPRKLVIDHRNWGTYIKKGNLFQNLKWFEQQKDEKGLKPNFLGLFTAGIEDLNPLLMLYALENHFEREDIEWYRVHYPNCTRESLLNLIEKVTQTRKLYDEVDNVLTWGLPEIKGIE